MFKSMTAYCRKTAAADGREISVEIRSVNNRFLDLSVRLPRTLASVEPRVRAAVSEEGISRGKVDIQITLNHLWGEDASATPPRKLDRTAAAEYIRLLRELRDEFSLCDDISVMRVAANPEIFTVEGADDVVDTDAEWAAIEPILGEALGEFVAGRLREGECLRADIEKKLAGVSALISRVEELWEASSAALYEKIKARITALIDDAGVTVDEGKLLTECALQADKLAIDEELVRLRSHIAALCEMLDETAPVGRKFDFQLQEVNREVNTICSKCQDAAIAAIGVELKNETEKLREQIQNIE